MFTVYRMSSHSSPCISGARIETNHYEILGPQPALGGRSDGVGSLSLQMAYFK